MIFEFKLGLGKASQGISTALSVEKTSKRGGKIVNIAAEQGKDLYIIVQDYSKQDISFPCTAHSSLSGQPVPCIIALKGEFLQKLVLLWPLQTNVTVCKQLTQCKPGL